MVHSMISERLTPANALVVQCCHILPAGGRNSLSHRDQPKERKSLNFFLTSATSLQHVTRDSKLQPRCTRCLRSTEPSLTSRASDVCVSRSNVCVELKKPLQIADNDVRYRTSTLRRSCESRATQAGRFPARQATRVARKKVGEHHSCGGMTQLADKSERTTV